MSVRTVRHLDCEGHALRDDILLCGETVDGQPGETAEDLRRRARSQEGWRRVDGRDLGPECLTHVDPLPTVPRCPVCRGTFEDCTCGGAA